MHIQAAKAFAKSAAISNGLSLTEEATNAVAEEIAASLAHDDAGQLIVVDANGNRAVQLVGGQVTSLDVGPWVASLVGRHGKPAAARPASTPNRPASRDGIGKLRSGLQAAREAESAAKVAAIVNEGNPWVKGRENRTAQAIVSKNNPELAKQWKAEAGVVQPGKYQWK